MKTNALIAVFALASLNSSYAQADKTKREEDLLKVKESIVADYLDMYFCYVATCKRLQKVLETGQDNAWIPDSLVVCEP